MSAGKLALRVEPAPLEPADGLLARLAIRHGCSELADFAPFVGGNAATAARAFDDVVPLVATLTGEDPDALAVRTMRLDAHGRPTLLGEIVDHRSNPSFGSRFGRVCPRCLAEDRRDGRGPVECRPHRRCWWDVGAIDACHRHRVLLVSDCSSCKSRLDRTRLHVATCRCGHDLAGASTQAVSPGDLLGDGYLLGRLGVGVRRSHEVLDRVPFGVAADMMLSVGIAACRPTDQPYPTHVRGAERARTATAGMRVLGGGPGAFRELLDAMVSAVPPAERSPERVYGALQRKLRTTPDRAFDWLRDELRAHAARNILHKAATRVLGATATDGAWTTLGQVAVRCGCSVERLDTVGRITGILRLNGSVRRSTPVAAGAAAELERFLGSTVEAAEAAIELGLDRFVFNTLIAAGLLARAFPIDGTSIPACYRKADVEELKRRVTGAKVLAETPAGAATIKSSVRACCRPIAGILKAILDGRITPLGMLKGGDGILATVVVMDELLAAMPREIDPDLISVPDAMRLLGVSPPTMAVLRSRGMLSPYKGRNAKRTVVGLDARELRAIDAANVGAMRLATAVDPPTHPKVVHRLMSEAGIRPSIDAPEPLFPRSEAMAVVRGWATRRGRSIVV